MFSRRSRNFSTSRSTNINGIYFKVERCSINNLSLDGKFEVSCSKYFARITDENNEIVLNFEEMRMAVLILQIFNEKAADYYSSIGELVPAKPFKKSHKKLKKVDIVEEFLNEIKPVCNTGIYNIEYDIKYFGYFNIVYSYQVRVLSN